MITPSRIAMARKRRFLTLAELSEKTKIAVPNLSKYENGKQEPSEETLRRLAAALNFPLSFFHQPDLDPIGQDAVSFRARSKLAAGARDAALTASRFAVELHRWIDERYRLPPNDLPTLGKPDPETAAEMVRARWGLGNAPISNMVHLLEAHGVRVFSLPPEFADINAFAHWRDGTPFVFLNTMTTPERGRFDAAHELGHLVLHGDERSFMGPEAEKEANAFASAFLMPQSAVIAHMPENPLVEQIIAGKGNWNVAAMALTYRLHDLGMMTDWHYRRTCIVLGERGYRRGEPRGMASRETSQLLDKVIRGQRAKGVGLADIARELHVTTEELGSWVFGLVITGRTGDNSGGPRPDGRPSLRLVPPATSTPQLRKVRVR
ncbi:XRE family transcriptional regulator [Catenulispora subtropica]|uniref:ImmA/IrrE family metallo-endopeptidase n=1 Tax=Catenulispora subtropica TaxID=450798 RepID=A0ABN2QWF7_9ACTN